MFLRHHSARHDKTQYIRLNTRLCKACWDCMAACRNNVIGRIDFLSHKHAHIKNAGNCKGCMACVRACRQKAILPLAQEVR